MSAGCRMNDGTRWPGPARTPAASDVLSTHARSGSSRVLSPSMPPTRAAAPPASFGQVQLPRRRSPRGTDSAGAGRFHRSTIRPVNLGRYKMQMHKFKAALPANMPPKKATGSLSAWRSSGSSTLSGSYTAVTATPPPRRRRALLAPPPRTAPTGEPQNACAPEAHTAAVARLRARGPARGAGGAANGAWTAAAMGAGAWRAGVGTNGCHEGRHVAQTVDTWHIL